MGMESYEAPNEMEFDEFPYYNWAKKICLPEYPFKPASVMLFSARD